MSRLQLYAPCLDCRFRVLETIEYPPRIERDDTGKKVKIPDVREECVHESICKLVDGLCYLEKEDF